MKNILHTDRHRQTHTHTPPTLLIVGSKKIFFEPTKSKFNFELNETKSMSVAQMVCELQLFKGKPPFATNSVLACIRSNMKKKIFQNFVNRFFLFLY